MKTFVLLLCFMLLVVAAPAMAQDTAMAGLKGALQAAAKWQADAKLASISSPMADANGKSRLWIYNFQSSKTKKCARVQLIQGMAPGIVDLGKCTADKPIATGYVDSPAAMQAAVKAGFKPDADGQNSMLLSISKDKLAKGKECWGVSNAGDFDPAKSVKRGWCVDAKSGTFYKRLSGEM